MLRAPADLTPDRLTALLKESGQLARGGVASIQIQPAEGQFGKGHQLYHLNIQYADTGADTLPKKLFLKFGKSLKEVFFYQTIAHSMPSIPLLYCYFASHDPQVDLACLLLEDLSESHWQTDWPLPPSEALCFQTIQALARIHALWWQHPRLESDFRPVIPPGRAWADRRAIALDRLPEFLTFLDDRLAASRRAVYQHMLSSTARPWDLPPGAPHQTLLHGDMHVWNVFYPRDPAGNLRIFDWNMWDIGRPTDDLAYMIAVHWYPERRARLEKELMYAYHRRLGECGITGYSREDLWEDYRASVIRSLLIPVWQWVRGILPGIWWPHLERTFLAFEDLECREMLD